MECPNAGVKIVSEATALGDKGVRPHFASEALPRSFAGADFILQRISEEAG